MIPQLIVCDDNTMEPANTCKLQNKLQLNNDQLSECEFQMRRMFHKKNIQNMTRLFNVFKRIHFY